MSSSDLTADDGYQSLLGKISEVFTTGRMRATQAVNTHITETYWQIGHDIVEFEQGGKTRADYGTGLLASLSRDLSARHGKGFSRSNVIRIRQFYLAFPKGATLSHQLSWSHIVELLKIEDPLERGFYGQQTIRERWAVRELKVSMRPDPLAALWSRFECFRDVRRRAEGMSVSWGLRYRVGAGRRPCLRGETRHVGCFAAGKPGQDIEEVGDLVFMLNEAPGLAPIEGVRMPRRHARCAVGSCGF